MVKDSCCDPDPAELSDVPAGVNIYPNPDYLHLASHVTIYRATPNPKDIGPDGRLTHRAFRAREGDPTDPASGDKDGLSCLRTRLVEPQHIQRHTRIKPEGLGVSTVARIEQIASVMDIAKNLGVFCTSYEQATCDPHCVIWNMGVVAKGQSPTEEQKQMMIDIAECFSAAAVPEQV